MKSSKNRETWTSLQIFLPYFKICELLCHLRATSAAVLYKNGGLFYRNRPVEAARCFDFCFRCAGTRNKTFLFSVKKNNRAVASPAMGTWARAHLDFQVPTFSFLVHFRVNLTANYPSFVCSLREQLAKMLTTRSSFDEYCISHKTDLPSVL